MKRLLYISLTILLMTILTACGGNNNSGQDGIMNNPDGTTNHDQEEQEAQTTSGDVTAQEDDQAYMKEQMDMLHFTEFELEVDYPEQKEVDAEIDQHSNGDIEATLDDDLNNKHLRGREAFDEIYPLISTLDISVDSTKEEVINQFIKAFDLPENYLEIEVEITLNDGTELKFESEQ